MPMLFPVIALDGGIPFCSQPQCPLNRLWPHFLFVHWRGFLIYGLPASVNMVMNPIWNIFWVWSSQWHCLDPLTGIFQGSICQIRLLDNGIHLYLSSWTILPGWGLKFCLSKGYLEENVRQGRRNELFMLQIVFDELRQIQSEAQHRDRSPQRQEVTVPFEIQFFKINWDHCQLRQIVCILTSVARLILILLPGQVLLWISPKELFLIFIKVMV